MPQLTTPLSPIQLYRKLLLARYAEEAIRKEYANDEMKTPVHLGIGSEAITVGVVASMPEKTDYFGTYRNHNLFLTLSEDTDVFFAELFGRSTGCAKGKAGSMHLSHPSRGLIMTSAVVATTIPVAVGAALAKSYLDSDQIVVVTFGEGAIEEGVFWESLNFAALKKLRVLFVCEDNELAIHTFKAQRRGMTSFADAVRAFGVSYDRGCGYDLNQVISKTRAMVDRMYSVPGPALLDFEYMRFLQHVGPQEDFEAGYRKRPTDMTSLDPVVLYRAELLSRGEKLAAIENVEKEIKAKIDQSLARARTAPFAEPSELLKDVFCEN